MKEPKNNKCYIDSNLNNNEINQRIKEENKKPTQKLIKISVFCFVFMCVELIGGYIAGSIAIMSDAAHLLSDLAGFIISLISLYIVATPANKDLTYGYHRAEIVGALASILIIWVLTLWLIKEAVERIFYPQPIIGLIMIGIAVCGVIFNLIMSKILDNNSDGSHTHLHLFHNHGHSHSHEDSADESENGNRHNDHKHWHGLEHNHKQEHEHNNGNFYNKSDFPMMESNNLKEPLIQKNNEEDSSSDTKEASPLIKAAYIHIIGDIIQSVGVILAAIVIYLFQDYYPRIRIFDPICTFIFAIIVIITTIPVSKECIHILMEGTPTKINLKNLLKELRKIEGVIDVHDIHVWSLNMGRISCTVHIVAKDRQKTLEKANIICNKFGIKHCTIQIEDEVKHRKRSAEEIVAFEENDIH